MLTIKNLLSTLTLTFISFALLAGPGESYESQNISYKLNGLADASAVLSLNYNDVSERFTVEMKDKVEWLEVTDMFGKAIYRVPVASNNVTVDLSDLERGRYNVSMYVEGKSEGISATLMKKR